jgi:exonuclease III/ribonuclease HI
MQWNAGGLRSRWQEFRQVITKHQFDVICIQETKLNSKLAYALPGYIAYRYDRPKGPGCNSSGGLVTYVKRCLKSTELDRPQAIECQRIRVVTSVGHVTLSNVYMPPGNDLSQEEARAFGELFDDRLSIVGGDLNARSTAWGSPETDARGRTIRNVIEGNDYVVINSGEPTRLNPVNGSMSHIDVTAASSQLAVKCKWEVLQNAMGSDHHPIRIVVNETPMRDTTRVPKWKLREAKWDVFTTQCENEVTVEKTYDGDVDTFNDQLSDAIRRAAEASVPQTGERSGNRSKPLPYWNDELRAAMYERNRARNKWRRSRQLADRVEYARLKARARRLVRSAASACWQEYCETLTSQTKLGAVWNMAKRMNGPQTSPSSITLREGDLKIDRDGDKAELLAKKFALVSSTDNYSDAFKAHKADVEQNHAHLYANDAPNTCLTGQLNRPFTLQELVVALRSVKKKSSPGEDRIVYDFLCRMPNRSLQALLRLYNAVWETGIMPAAWRHAIVIPILKAGKDPSAGSSYRPISLTSVLCKLMEKMAVARLQWFLEKQGLLSQVQSGFRRGRSTMDHIVRLQDAIVRQVCNHSHVLAVFLDMEKAFDMVWRTGLMIKLKRLGVNGHMFEWVRSFMNDRTFQVRVGTALSQAHELENGTAQGTILSPLAFVVMIDDLPDNMRAVETSLYADDAMMYKGGGNVKFLSQKVQHALDEAKKWADNWGFKISADKSVAVLFGRNSANQRPDVKLHIGNAEIKVERNVKFLGVIFDHGLTWRPHIDYVYDRCQKRLNLMRAVSGQRWGACKHTLMMIYRALIRSVLDYGAIVYDCAAVTQVKRIELIQNAAMRLACGAWKSTPTAALQIECGEKPLQLRRLAQQLRFAVKVKATKQHVAGPVVAEHWTTVYGDYTEQRRPLATKVERYLQLHGESENVAGPEWAPIPPWTVKLPTVDTELTGTYNKRENPIALAAAAKEKIQSYKGRIHVYTDASKTTEGRVGIGCYLQVTTSESIKISARVTDRVSVYAGELAAIQTAMESIKQLAKCNGNGKFAIFSDSLSAIAAFRSGKCNTRPNLFSHALYAINGVEADIVLVWVPSHIGIEGNELADTLASEGTEHQSIDYDIGFELQDAFHNIDRFVDEEWQLQWENDKTAKLMHQLEPNVRRSHSVKQISRRLETFWLGLRLERCRLNASLHKIGKHDTGLCDACRVPETVEHYLLECPAGPAAEVVEKCESMGRKADIEAVLGSQYMVTFVMSVAGKRLLRDVERGSTV